MFGAPPARGLPGRDMPETRLVAFALCAFVALLGVVLLRAPAGELTHRVLGWSLVLVAAAFAGVATLATLYVVAFPNT